MKPRFFASPTAWRAWLEKNHANESELLVGFYKTSSGRPSITWPESVDEALCFGWIDGVRRSVDAEAYTIRFTPRKKSSIWSNVNVKKVAALTELGKMEPAGRAAFAARKEDRTAVYSFERTEDAALSPEHERALRKNRAAASFFDAQSPSYRRAALHWVVSAKREETRDRRFAQLLADCTGRNKLAHLIAPVGKGTRATSRGDR